MRCAVAVMVLLVGPTALRPAHGQTAVAAAGSAKPIHQKIFLIGNSLTWDTVPALLAGDVDWHVDCGKNLQYIYDHPEKPCVPSSTLWPAALKQNRYAILCVQPHYGTTLAQDVEVIGRWIELQPQAVLVIHTGWARHADMKKEFHAPLGQVEDETKMTHSPAYFAALHRELAVRYPKLEIRSTEAMQVIDAIGHDVQKQQAPLAKISELYRDEIHLTVQGGRYLAHNLMRRALGQPTSSQGFQLEPVLQSYLDQKIRELAH